MVMVVIQATVMEDHMEGRMEGHTIMAMVENMITMITVLPSLAPHMLILMLLQWEQLVRLRCQLKNRQSWMKLKMTLHQLKGT